jgi:O-antigen ligase
MKKCRQNGKRIFIFTIITVITGSVFLTSGRFVNETNTPKYYFVVISLLVMAAFIAISQNHLNFCTIRSKTIYWGIIVICFLQACYGLSQFLGWFPSNHSRYTVAGSFDNPVGFAAVLAIGFPIGLFLLATTKNIEKYLASATLAVIVIAVFFSGSRAGMLAIIISLVSFVLFNPNIMDRLRQYGFYKSLIVLTIICFIPLASILYLQKKDSANGRLLIWKVSTEMIKDKPLFGHGYGAFQAKYMDYQAGYFKINPNSTYSQLADNVKHPFNEFIKVTVEFGMVGLVVVLASILFVLWKIVKSGNENQKLALNGLISFLVFACFSYPLQYISVWILLALYFSVLLQKKETEIKNTPVSIITRSVIVLSCTFFIAYTFMQICAEMKWKTIAMNSLNGNTEEMLPEYDKLYSTLLKQNPFFLYNYGAELNVAGKFDKSAGILTECKKRFNDYDLQLLLADNYHKKGEPEKAIQTYQHASNMIPCRFLPLYQIFEIYKDCGQMDMAAKYAHEIMNKKVKIPSLTVNSIKEEAEEYLKETKSMFGNRNDIQMTF